MTRLPRLTLGLLALIVLTGCASPKGTVSFTVAADRYEETISAVRDTLADARFKIDRVDAEDGIISTYPKPTAGLGTPWDSEQPTFNAEIQDLVNQHERVARVLFEGDQADLRRASGILQVQVEVIVYRVRRANWRIETESISRSTHARDPLSVSRGQPARFSQPIRRDDIFAAELADRIRARLSIEPAAPEPASP